MFYSQFILAKKGPLGTIWIAAHLERKLRKNQVADTDIGVSVDSILSPDVPIALRLSSHLLLGVVRVYSRKVNYLFDDCSDALLKVKQAFRSAAVDLPPEESKAPYHSITLPETFDLDDFELPDNDIFQGNFVDHHISAREQITLQDNMEGVGYITSKFGLDERFGDGGASALDLDEDLFLDKIGTAGQTNERSDPQPSVGTITTLKQDEQPETTALNSGIRVDGVDYYADPMDYAQAPSTPGLVEEPNLSNVQEVSDHLETECSLVGSTMTQNAKTNTYGDKQEVDWCSADKTNSDAIAVVLTEEQEYHSDGLDINLSKPLEESPIQANVEHDSVHASSSGSNKLTSDLLDQVKALNPPLELADKINESSDVPCTSDLENGDANKDKNSSLVIDKPNDGHQGINKILLDKNACEFVSANDQGSLGLQVPNGVEMASHDEKQCPDYSKLASKSQDGSFLQNPETQLCHEPTDLRLLNLDVHENVASSETPFLRPCNSNVGKPDITSGCVMSTDADVQSDVAALATSGREETVMLGEAYCVTDNSEGTLKENNVEEHASEDINAASSETKSQVRSEYSHDGLVENPNNSTESELPAPEKLLLVPEGHVDLHEDILVKGSPGAFVGLDESDAGSKIVSGKKRSFTESTLTQQSLNLAASSRLVRFKRTVESVPDDDDLLSSILVGRSSVLNLKPTPRLSEVTSMKRSRAAPRTDTLKRKVPMDDTMVLHGDTIRQQLTNTEDIRRVRKKAPCTRPEISLIQKQYLEDEIFLEPIFTGMSLELVFLHSQTSDVSGITVCKNDLASLETAAEMTLPSEDNENVVPLETMVELMLACHDIKNDNSLATAGPHISSQKAEDLEIPQLSNNMMKEMDETNEEITISRDQTKTTSDVDADPSQLELLLDVTRVQTNEKIDNATNCSDVAGLETLHSIGYASAGIVEQDSITETVDTNASDEKTDLPYTELESAVMDVDNGQAASRDELTGKDGDFISEVEFEPEAMDNVTPEVGGDGSTVALLSNAKHGETEHIEHGENNSVVSGKHIVASHYSEEVGLHEDGFMNNGEDPEQTEVHECYMMDAENSGIDLHNQEELKYPAARNDTEFLNVDDDELNEIDDDHIPDDEEARFTENTGWSSRTRAVSKYLQTLFIKEAELGIKSLSMDNLLIGKSRKEASRMFFEALVLKTRDYLNVEQRSPFDDITIKPRTRLIKSDF